MLQQGAGSSRGSASAGGHGVAAMGYRSRRAHTKTRTGCRTCRQRKVKCDETRPICTNCSKRGLHSECEYRDSVVWVHQTNPHSTATPISTSASTSSPGTPSSSSSCQSAPRSDASACGSTPELSPGTIDLSNIETNILPPCAPGQSPIRTLKYISNPTTSPTRLTHTDGYTISRYIPGPTSLSPLIPTHLTTLRLLHFFTTATALSLSTRSAVHKIWQIYCPTLALRLANYPGQAYLLHAMLAVAGLHAAKIGFNKKGNQKESVEKKRKRETESKQWLVIASEEHQLCLEGFRAVVARFASRGLGDQISGSRSGNTSSYNEGQDNIDKPMEDGKNVAPKYRGASSREEEELEAVFFASSLLCVYGCSITTIEVDQEIDLAAKRETRSSLSPSNREPSPSTTLPTPNLTWLPLARGALALIRFSPLTWDAFTCGRLAPFPSAMEFFVPHHPYTHILSSLESLLSSTYELHPRLPQPASPLTGAVFTKVIDTIKFSFERFFTYKDPIAATMSFPVRVDDKFIISVRGRGGSGEGVVGDRERCGGVREGDGVVMDRDPRSLVIMAHFMVLMVIIESLVPGEKQVVGLGECEWRGGWDDDGSDIDGHESDRNNDERGLERDARLPDGASPQSPQHEVRPSISREWWVSGLGRREIIGIAVYLREVDAEETRMGSDGGGRWTKWMKWPLEMIQGNVAARAAYDYVPQGIKHEKHSAIRE
ncbi:hypothetical protein EV426DRAFT_705394 [Tirmania nivea]|nr:hypothetical protein EV426DRAFT_705394 [Tirmania nivea]